MKIKLLNIFRKLRHKFTRLNIENNNASSGIIYIVFSNRMMLNECIVSIISLRKFNKNIPISIFTDEKDYITRLLEKYLITKNVNVIEILAQQQRAKVDFIGHSPYEKTLYLDSDTIVNFDICHIFKGLKHFDVLFTPDFSRKKEKYKDSIKEYAEISMVIPEVNGGVFAFKRNAKTNELFRSWRKYFYKYFTETDGYDQASFRVAISKTENLKSIVMPYEFNVRPVKVLQKCLKDEDFRNKTAPKIIHKHFDLNLENMTIDDIELFIHENKLDDLLMPYN